jgi:hypothetical protein
VRVGMVGVDGTGALNGAGGSARAVDSAGDMDGDGAGDVDRGHGWGW